VEFKSWLDLKTTAGKAKVVKSLLALRNNGGGYLVIGFDDKTRLPVDGGRPADVSAAFHPDTVQRLVKTYCRPAFEVEVRLGTRDQKQFPVMVVPAGVRSPVIARAPITDGVADGTVTLIRQNAVYMRTVNSGVVESTEPRLAEDWDRLIETCFDNREAEIRRFLRRHAPALAREIRADRESGSPTQGRRGVTS
jgi:predicted HTH transcriptional regulator